MIPSRLTPVPDRPTWTEGAEEGPQGVHLPGDQCVADLLLVLGRREQALGQHPGLVLPWKTELVAPWLRVRTGVPGRSGPVAPSLAPSPPARSRVPPALAAGGAHR